MTDYRIKNHPIISQNSTESAIEFTWQGQVLPAYPGDTIASALYAKGIRVFGRHPKDGAPQGIFCANGQCSQCLVLENKHPVKACMTLIKPGMVVEPVNGLPVLPVEGSLPEGSLSEGHAIETIDVTVLIIGGGPAGLSAAIELGQYGVQTLVVDDKHQLGGKLVLQTHRFFGSRQAVHAGMRGIDIARTLSAEVARVPNVMVWTDSPALAVFSDGVVGIYRDGIEYVLVRPKVLLVAAGAREKALAFKGNTLPGVLGAGAFQTLVNRDLVRPAESLFIVGGGNVGLIAGYHALQAGIKVVGLVEALPECGGYKVHQDKLVRLGVPVYTSHTILSANGEQAVESVTIARLDERFNPVQGTEKSFSCEAVLVAVGLEPVNEFSIKARQYGLPVFSAGDADEIAEASAAMFSGRIKGREIARYLGLETRETPPEWTRTAEILKSKPGAVIVDRVSQTHPAGLRCEVGTPAPGQKVFPVLHCTQEIPCDPCARICPQQLIAVDPDDIRSVPQYHPDSAVCKACERCVAICPGLAITLVDYRQDPDDPSVTIPFEFGQSALKSGDIVTVTGTSGEALAELEVQKVTWLKINDRTAMIKVKAPAAVARKISGIRLKTAEVSTALDPWVSHIADDTIICRCERVTAGEIRCLIRQGYRDVNELKIVSRAAMGACGSKTCAPLIARLFKEEGVSQAEVQENTRRPLFIEVPLGVFAGIRRKGD